jgi:hypothetical protein
MTERQAGMTRGFRAVRRIVPAVVILLVLSGCGVPLVPLI